MSLFSNIIADVENFVEHTLPDELKKLLPEAGVIVTKIKDIVDNKTFEDVAKFVSGGFITDETFALIDGVLQDLLEDIATAEELTGTDTATLVTKKVQVLARINPVLRKGILTQLHAELVAHKQQTSNATDSEIKSYGQLMYSVDVANGQASQLGAPMI